MPTRCCQVVRIYGYPVSTWTRTVWMTCIEKGIDHELVPIAYGSAEHAALHPFLRVPIIDVGGRTLTETLAITGLLDETFPRSVAATRGRCWARADAVCG